MYKRTSKSIQSEKMRNNKFGQIKQMYEKT